MRKRMFLLLCCLFCIGLTGCGSQIPFTWSLDRVPQNLDPQLAIEGPELVAVTNLYSGLVRLDADGEPQLECAERVEISADGLQYTFTLKEGLSYNKLKKHTEEYTVTAHDFVFAFRRVYRANTASPYTGSFSAIQNSAEVLAGQLGEIQLGVKALDDTTLRFTLSQPDDEFLKKLALPGAMPCNEAFFASTQGAYGLTAATTLANGSFYLYNWNEHGLFLRRDENGQYVTSVRLVLDTSGQTTAAASGEEATVTPISGEQKIKNEYATAALQNGAVSGSYPSIPYTARSWVLLFNCQHESLANADVRRALAAVAYSTEVSLPENFSKAEGLIPPAVTLNGESYRGSAARIVPSATDVTALCRDGLAALGKTQFSNVTILVPEGEPYTSTMNAINQQWQKQFGSFSAYFSVKQLPQDELLQAVAKGDYSIALVPMDATVDSTAQILQQVQYAKLDLSEFSSGLAALNSTAKPSLDAVQELERLAVEQGAACPMWFETQHLVTATGVQSLVFRPFGPVLDLTYTTISE